MWVTSHREEVNNNLFSLDEDDDDYDDDDYDGDDDDDDDDVGGDDGGDDDDGVDDDDESAFRTSRKRANVHNIISFSHGKTKGKSCFLY